MICIYNASIYTEIMFLKLNKWEFLWWLSGEESACRCRQHGFYPWSGKIPHVTEQLSPCATTIEPVLQSLEATATEPHGQQLEPVFSRTRAPQQEKPPQ